MSEDPGHLELDGDVIRYSSETYPEWSIRVDDICLMGEATNQNGPFAGDYFLCFATRSEKWREASFYAAGCGQFLTDLGARLGVNIELALASSTDFDSRIVWPLEWVGKPMFQYQEVPPRTVVGRLFGSMQVNQKFSEHALAVLAK